MFLVLKEFYENVYLLAFEIHDTVVMFCYGRIFGKPYVSMSIPTIKY